MGVGGALGGGVLVGGPRRIHRTSDLHELDLGKAVFFIRSHAQVSQSQSHLGRSPTFRFFSCARGPPHRERRLPPKHKRMGGQGRASRGEAGRGFVRPPGATAVRRAEMKRSASERDSACGSTTRDGQW